MYVPCLTHSSSVKTLTDPTNMGLGFRLDAKFSSICSFCALEYVKTAIVASFFSKRHLRARTTSTLKNVKNTYIHINIVCNYSHNMHREFCITIYTIQHINEEL